MRKLKLAIKELTAKAIRGNDKLQSSRICSAKGKKKDSVVGLLELLKDTRCR